MSCLDGGLEKDMVVSLVVLPGWKRLVLWRELFWFTVCDRFSLHPTSCQWVRGSHIVVRVTIGYLPCAVWGYQI